MLELKLNVSLTKKNIIITVVLLMIFFILLILVSISNKSDFEIILNYEIYKYNYLKFLYIFISLFSVLNISIFLYIHDNTMYNELIAYTKRGKMYFYKLFFYTLLSIIVTLIYIFVGLIISRKNIFFFLTDSELYKVFGLLFDNLIFTYVSLLFIRKNKRQLIFLFLTIFIIINLVYVLLDLKYTRINFYYIFSLSGIYENPYNFIFISLLLSFLILINYLKYKNETIII